MGPITAEEMRKIEKKAAELGLSPLLLMENAGRAVAERILGLGASRTAILAGTGNNGGDGFVVARHLTAFGKGAAVFLLGKPLDIRTEEASLNWRILNNLNIKTAIIEDQQGVKSLGRALKQHDLIVDAMLGTGVKGDLRDPIASAVELVNSFRIPVLAVDVPTGVDPTTGKVSGSAVVATRTITFHRMKKGLLKARKYTGKIEVVSIGIPPDSRP